jgi:hypothetical protein
MSMWAGIHGQVNTEMMELGYTVISMLPASFQRRSIVVQMFLCLQTFVGLQLSDKHLTLPVLDTDGVK